MLLVDAGAAREIDFPRACSLLHKEIFALSILMSRQCGAETRASAVPTDGYANHTRAANRPISLDCR